MCDADYDWVLDDLALGNIITGSNLDNLRAINIDAIVCALPTPPHPVKTYTDKGFSLFHLPIDDSPDVDIEKWFDDVVYFIMAHRLMNRKVLVHCHAGVSRSATLVCAFLMNLFRCDDVKAIYWVRDKRSCININSGFLKQLRHYAQTITRPQQLPPPPVR